MATGPLPSEDAEFISLQSGMSLKASASISINPKPASVRNEKCSSKGQASFAL